MPTPKKEAIVEELRDMLSRATLTVVADYRGLKVADLQGLRTTLRPLGGEARVAKNTLATIAADQAGVPQLVMPLAYDQADNAVRMRRHGAASVLYPKRFTGKAVAKRLKQLLDDDGIKQAARKASERFRGVDGVSTACALVEELVGRDATPA